MTSVDTEIEDATRCWNFEYTLHENSLKKGSYIFEAKNMSTIHFSISNAISLAWNKFKENIPTWIGASILVLILGAIEKDGKVVLVHPSQKTENGLDIA